MKQTYISLLSILLLSSCYKKQIQFGNDLTDSHTRLVTIDTITPVISTYVMDSFPTSGNSVLLAGRYIDPVVGTVSAQTFFQLGVPAGIADELPEDATYDSLVLELNPNGYYYGDTSKAISLSVYEMENQPEFTYASRLFNTSSVPVLPAALATVKQLIRPNVDELVRIRLSDVKGSALFNKINTEGVTLKEETAFLDYFKGLSIQVANNETGAVYAFAPDSSTKLRLHYHLSNPFPEKKVFEFYVTRTTYQFNRIITDRTGTFLEETANGKFEFPATPAYPYGVTQAGNGTLLKIKFPSLRQLLQLDNVVQLVDAQLVIKPVESTFDPYKLRLPPSFILAQTDATNSIGYTLADGSGEQALMAPVIIDDIYHLNTRYSFAINSYINSLLATPNSAEAGVFVMDETPGSTKNISRAVIGSSMHPQYKTQLVLTLLLID